MHETAITSGLMKILIGQATRHGVRRIVKVTVKVGRLRAIEPRQLRACFELFAEGTLAEGAELVIDETAVRGCCNACSREFEVERFHFECPACGSNEISVLSGQELFIESFEAADD